MAVEPLFFRDLGYVFLAAVGGAALAWWARQPLILGYVVGGILIGPFTPGPVVAHSHTFELFAEIGVVLLMFSIGMEFSLRDLLRVKSVALLGGPLGILLSVVLSLLAGSLLGWRPLQAVVIGFVISVASTMVLARLLVDRGELHSPHGRVMIGITLVEDLAVVVLTVLLPVLGAIEPGRIAAIAQALLTGVVILVPFSYLAAKVIPRVMTLVAATRNDELFLIVALAVALGTAALTQAVGLSLALGAFLAGMLISHSDYAHETLARLLPLRDAFVALFFVTVGGLVDPSAVFANPGLLATILGLIVVGKLVVWTVVVVLFGYPLRTAVLVGVGLTQIGEFSFILVQAARTAGHVGGDVHNATLAASLISILVNALLVRYVPDWLARRDRAEAHARLASAPPAPPAAAGGEYVVLCGAGRVGSVIGEALETFGVPFTIVERDPHRIADLRARGRTCLFGDAGHRDVLRHAGIERASLLIVALPELAPALRAVQAARRLNPEITVLARAHGRTEGDELRHAGATEVIQPEVEASATLIRHALARLRLPKHLTTAYLERYRDAVLEGRDAGAPAGAALPEVREVRIGEAGLADRTLREAAIRERFGVTVVAVLRGAELLLNPAPETRLRAGDVVRVFGLPDQIAGFDAAASRTRGDRGRS